MATALVPTRARRHYLVGGGVGRPYARTPHYFLGLVSLFLRGGAGRVLSTPRGVDQGALWPAGRRFYFSNFQKLFFPAFWGRFFLTFINVP